MKETSITWILGTCALVPAIASLVLDLIFANTLADIRPLSTLRILLWASFGLSLITVASLVFFIVVFVQKLNNRSISFDPPSAWRRLGVCAALCATGTILSVVTLVWLVVRQPQLPPDVWHHLSKAILVVWVSLWALAAILQTAVFTFVGFWTTRVLRAQSVRRLDLDFDIPIPPMDEARPTTSEGNRSFQSQGPTLTSPPRTPTTHTGSSSRYSSATRVGPGSARAKFVARESARSSVEFPAYEATSIDRAFDSWDTSSVHHEIRAALHSSPPPTRSGLETIPGSRSVSPAHALDGPFLPESPHATSSDIPLAFDWTPNSPPKQPSSSPPSTPPPNFSRPTSRSYNKPNLAGPSMTELIHPLFRPNSPRPPPIAVTGTMVTASPLANQPITPRTLARLRANTMPQQWKPSPSLVRSEKTESTLGSPGPGSPGPSIMEDEELPPILPGFVLSAGSRSSFVGYGRRKSSKERRLSSYSHGSRNSILAG